MLFRILGYIQYYNVKNTVILWLEAVKFPENVSSESFDIVVEINKSLRYCGLSELMTYFIHQIYIEHLTIRCAIFFPCYDIDIHFLKLRPVMP